MNKKKLTLNEHVDDCLDKGEGRVKGSRGFIKPAAPSPVQRLEDEAKEANWDDGLFQKWIDLRTRLEKNRKGKDWRAEINVCEEIIQLNDQAKFISIMTPLFYKDMAKAYEKLEDRDNSLKYYRLAKEGLLKYRSEHKLNSPDDWLNDINSIDERVSELTGDGEK
jgi:hypothetical protein